MKFLSPDPCYSIELTLRRTVPAVFLKLTIRNTSIFTATSSENKLERVEVITGVQRRRRWTPEEKLALVQQTY